MLPIILTALLENYWGKLVWSCHTYRRTKIGMNFLWQWTGKGWQACISRKGPIEGTILVSFQSYKWAIDAKGNMSVLVGSRVCSVCIFLHSCKVLACTDVPENLWLFTWVLLTGTKQLQPLPEPTHPTSPENRFDHIFRPNEPEHVGSNMDSGDRHPDVLYWLIPCAGKRKLVGC